MKFSDVTQVKDRWDENELLKFDERDPCYTWLFPLALGPIDPAAIWSRTSLPRLREELTLYVHIPFCRFICKMCPFTHEPLVRRDLDAYVEALLTEIDFYGQHPQAAGRKVSTLYFGGGTASSLTAAQAARILEALRSRFQLDGAQITLECHPRTVDRDYLEQIREAGVNRVSFGIQSFQQRFIDSLKLHQQVAQSRRILEEALKVGFDTVAMDLMFRYADQERADLKAELDAALAIGVHGISTYALDTEIRSLRGTAARQGPVGTEAEMYYYLHDRLLDEGFVHVAQPDYARPGHENQQLRDLWGAPQAENLSFGAGAFSESFNGVTWANVHDSNRYTQMLAEGRVPVLMGQVHTWDDAVARFPALGVRCLRFALNPFQERFGVSFLDLYRLELAFLKDKGWISLTDGTLQVTRSGKYFIDNISKAFFNPRNRGKSQLWGVQLQDLMPHHAVQRSDLLARAERGLRPMTR